MKVYTVDVPITVQLEIFAEDADEAGTEASLLITAKMAKLPYKVSLGDADVVDSLVVGEHDDNE